MHFGPKSRAPSLFENLNPNDIGALLKFITVQSESTLNIEDAIKPDPNYNSIIVFACAAAFIAGLIFTGLIKASTIFQNTYIWSILINVNVNFCLKSIKELFRDLLWLCYPVTCGQKFEILHTWPPISLIITSSILLNLSWELKVKLFQF